jgi:hypothetical protein
MVEQPSNEVTDPVPPLHACRHCYLLHCGLRPWNEAASIVRLGLVVSAAEHSCSQWLEQPMGVRSYGWLTDSRETGAQSPVAGIQAVPASRSAARDTRDVGTCSNVDTLSIAPTSRHHDAAKRSKVAAQYAQTTGWCGVGGNLSIRPRCVIGASDREMECFSLILGSAQPASIVEMRERRGPHWSAFWRRLPQRAHR